MVSALFGSHSHIKPGAQSSLVSLLLFMLICSTHVFAQDLDPEQQQILAAVESGLNRVQTNLQLAIDSAGSGTPTGSKAKLSKMRLDTAAVDMPQVKQWLAELPADNAQVITVAEQVAATEQSIAELNDRLTGKPPAPAAAPASPAPAAATAAPAVRKTTAPATQVPAAAASSAAAAASTSVTDAPVRLGYQQEDILKGAHFNLREVQGNVNSLNTLMTELKPIEDQMSINYRKVLTAMSTLENGRRKAGFTQDGLNKLPPNGQGVAETAAELSIANGQLDSAEAYFAPLNQALTQLIDPANYPNLQTDLKRLNELSEMYRDPMILQNDRQQAAAVLPQADAAKEEAVRIAQVYLPLMVQETEEGKRVEGSGNGFLQNLAAFQAAAEQERQSLPQQIRSDMGEANSIADQAVTEQKPLFFTGGVPQSMTFAQDKLDLYKVLDPQQSSAMEKEFKAMQDSLALREKSLSQLIIQENPLPSDRYTGGDRNAVVAVAIDAWKHQQSEFEVLTNRIPSESWSRETMWQYSNGTWYYVDRSRLQVQLIVADKENDQQAVILPINIWKDHQKGDSMIGTPLWSGDDTLQPSSYMLRNKIK